MARCLAFDARLAMRGALRHLCLVASVALGAITSARLVEVRWIFSSVQLIDANALQIKGLERGSV